MIDWLRRDREPPTVACGDAVLPIVIRRHPRARRMTLRLAPDGSEARVTMPRWGRSAEAWAFARSRADWLASQLACLPQAATPVPGGKIGYRGRPLTIHWSADAPRLPRLAGPNALLLGGPRDNLAMRLQRWLETEALRLMQADLEDFCLRANVPVAPLRLSRARRRWGSCAVDGTVRMNWRLVQAPDHARRSVVAHEVAHLIHFDHGPAFHALLEDLFDGDMRDASAWLKREGHTLYAAFG